MTGNTTTTVSVNDVAVSLEAQDSGNHALVLATPNGTLRVVGTVGEIRQAAYSGLSLPIPALPRPTASAPASHAAPEGSTEARFASIEASLATLTQIAEAARRRGLI